jgi:hypothetical protein
VALLGGRSWLLEAAGWGAQLPLWLLHVLSRREAVTRAAGGASAGWLGLACGADGEHTSGADALTCALALVEMSLEGGGADALMGGLASNDAPDGVARLLSGWYQRVALWARVLPMLSASDDADEGVEVE